MKVLQVHELVCPDCEASCRAEKIEDDGGDHKVALVHPDNSCSLYEQFRIQGITIAEYLRVCSQKTTAL